MSRGPVLFKTGSGTNDNDVVLEIASNADDNDTYIIGSTAGAMDVFVSLDGTNYLATAVALIDLTSTTPATEVALTTAGKAAALKGRFKKIKFLQNGVTAVENAGIIGYNS